jgi:uncharacterized protein
MRQVRGAIHLSATDLANHLACHHLSRLDQAAAQGRLKPPDYFEPDAAILRERGDDHEAAFLAHLEKAGLRLARPAEASDEETGAGRTLSAMREGADVIVQATLQDGAWSGRADVLQRVPRPSRLGDWSYEVWDTKLARETKGGSVLQICFYSDLLATVQGVRPEYMYVVPPRDDFVPDRYRVDEYMAYYRLVRRRLNAAVCAPGDDTYPEPVEHCDICRWWPTCDARRRKDDHLSLVAGISRLQTRELVAHDVTTLAALATTPLPLAWKPSRGAAGSYTRVREQARVQKDGRDADRMVYELLPQEPGRGLERLPAPSPGDVFFDLEGDPFVGRTGREYLFGWAVPGGTAGAGPEYRSLWALDADAERAAFETFVDVVMERWARHPDLHVYHYAPYEPAALKRLMGRHATRGNEIDRMLRAGLFVDLYAVVRQTLRASVEEYSIKKLEPLYDFTRAADLRDAGVNLRLVQRALELEEPGLAGDDVRGVVETYNRDDCLSALQLRDWLESVRGRLEAEGKTIARPPLGEGQPSDAVADRESQTREVMDALLEGVPAERAERTEEQQARYLLAHMLEWHRREEKATWWEFFRLRELSDEALLDEKAAISDLEYASRAATVKSRVVDRYRFPAQETSVRKGDKLRLPSPHEDRELGEVHAVDIGARTVDILKTGASTNLHPSSVFAWKRIDPREMAGSLLRLGRWVMENGIDAPGPHRAARDLLLARSPRLGSPPPAVHAASPGTAALTAAGTPLLPFGAGAGAPLRGDDETGVQAARRLVVTLERGTLAIQGPPGTGKTYTGARMICDLVRRGKKVGVCAQSHKVIRNLLDKIVEAANEENVEPRCAHKGGEDVDDGPAGGVTPFDDNPTALRALKTGAARVLGGTAWLWSREEFLDAVDVLFVDEAGQMALANVLAISQAAPVLVLLGDPRQLDQPLQGTHPEGTEVSALQHLLGDHQTIADDRGLFLEETWRLHPDICRLTSELFYDGRLKPIPGLEVQAILGRGPIEGAGLWFLPVVHEGNTSASREEVDAVAALVERLTGGGLRWRNRHGEEAPLGLQDILVIAPYNAQVADLSVRLPGARVGTVDKFQGQEAPVVIYSMTTSSPADAPRGMEFLYSLNRFNVATSRARCACIVVGSPLLFEPECQTPRQMQLANACCRYLELARELRRA